ncbi:response regulator [Candidatus Woesearchaeota archaeon]|nr:MAG: response regulator [Candidatus Woesearchaeota archaeon]
MTDQFFIPTPVKERDLETQVAIAGTGGVHPPYLLDDAVIEHFVHNFDPKRAKKTFAQVRREKLGTELLFQTRPEYTIEDCMADAAKQALERAGMTMSDIAEIHISTVSPTDRISRSRSAVSEKLGVNNIPIMELSHGCAGSLYALESGRRASLLKNAPILVIAGDDVRRDVINLQDWAQSGIFGSGAGSAILVPVKNGKGLHPVNFWTDTTITPYARMDPMTGKFAMDGKKLGELAPATYHAFLDYLLQAYNLPKDKVYVIPHQLNGHLIEEFRKQAELREDQVLNIVNRFGNTSNGSVLLALNHAITHRLKIGNYGVIFGVGAGFDKACSIYEPDRELILPRVIKILIADDEQGVRESKVMGYQTFLEGHEKLPQNVSFEYHTATSGEEAFQMALEIHPDILDFDQRMEGMNGSTAATMIHEALGPIPTVINSGFSDAADMRAFGELKLTKHREYILKQDMNIMDYANFLVEFMYKSNIL